MQAVVLVGGQGTRLRPLTETTPKPLLPVANVPMVRRIIDRMPPEVDEVFLAVNYKLELLADYFRTHYVGRNVTLIEEKEPLGTAGAIKNVAPHLDGTFLVFNGDVLDSLDISKLLAFHQKKGGAATLALWRVADPTHFGVMEMKGDRILRFVEKPATREEAPSDLANAGTYVLDAEILDHIPEGRAVSIERDTYPALLAKGEKMFGMEFGGFWVDCGRAETYLRANEAVLRASGRNTLLGERTVNKGAVLSDWAIVGADCKLGTDVEISRSVLLDGVVIGNTVTIKDSIVGAGVHVADDAALVDCVVGDHARIDKGVLLKGVKVSSSKKTDV